MKNRLPSQRWTVVLVLAGLASTAWAEDAAKMFDSLFGQEVKRVKATRGYDDDQKLAADLLAVAEKRRQDTALVEVICRTAYDLAGKTPTGFPTAAKAMALLAECVPEKGAACREKILSIRRRQYGAARGAARPGAGGALIDALVAVADDKAQAKNYAEALRLFRQAVAIANVLRSPRLAELQAEVRNLTAVDLAWRQIVQMQARLKANPKDEFARRRLIELHLVELDDPAGAAKYLTDDSDERLRTYIPLAGQDADQLAAQACTELAEWYLSLTDKATTNGKITVLVRAKGYYETFLEKYDKTDLTRTKATLALERVEAELERLEPTPKTVAKWIDVLRLVDPDKHAVDGRWARRGGRVGVAAREHARVGIPVAPKGDYELKVQFVRIEGSNDVNTILPVGNTSVVVMLSSNNGSASGLTAINGKLCDSNDTRTSGSLTNDTAHNLHVKVTTKDDQAEISATLDGKKLLEWEGPQSALSSTSGWRLPNQKILGVGTDSGSTTIFNSVQLRMLSGKAAPAPFAVRSRRDPDEDRDRRRRWWEDRRRGSDRGRGSRGDWRRRSPRR